jgi:hypothetical protein
VRAAEKVPASAEALENWLVRRIEEEYATDVRYAAGGPGKGAGKPKPGKGRRKGAKGRKKK